jgi:hypothetical protein
MNGYLMNITWKTNASGSWAVIGTNTSIGNNTYHCATTGLMDSYNTHYYWRVEVNDGHGHWNNKTYSFTTLSNQEYTLTITKVGNGAVAIDPDQPTSTMSCNSPPPQTQAGPSPNGVVITAVRVILRI